jgi:fatty-acyl-CoA synthase
VSPTVASLLLARADDDRPGLRFEDQTWTWREHVEESARRSALLREVRREGEPFHVGVLLENVPDFSFFLGAAALAGAVVVGINPTRRGGELERDIRHTDCQVVVTDRDHASLLEGLDLPPVLSTDDLDLPDAAPVPFDPGTNEDDVFMLIFTSGTSGAPKAVRCTHRKIAVPGQYLTQGFGIGPDDVCYLAMPLFHSNAVMAGWSVGVTAGATLALRRRFSASGFLPDVRRYGVTYFNYVGKPLSYILATPEQPDDDDNPLRIAFGNEAADRDIARFGERFGCMVVDAFGSTEGGINISRTPDAPEGSLGRPAPGIVIVDPDGKPCLPARFDADGRLLNPDEAIGELVNTEGAGGFEGYYRNDDADRDRLRNGWYRSGDLAYADEAGFYYFAGRTLDWLRVDGENLAAAPIERILARHPDVVLAAVYAVPSPDGVGDEVMAALALRPDAALTPDDLGPFLAAQADLGTKWAPRYVRITKALPQTETNKILKRVLAQEGTACDDPVWVRPGKELVYKDR